MQSLKQLSVLFFIGVVCDFSFGNPIEYNTPYYQRNHNLEGSSQTGSVDSFSGPVIIPSSLDNSQPSFSSGNHQNTPSFSNSQPEDHFSSLFSTDDETETPESEPTTEAAVEETTVSDMFKRQVEDSFSPISSHSIGVGTFAEEDNSAQPSGTEGQAGESFNSEVVLSNIPHPVYDQDKGHFVYPSQTNQESQPSASVFSSSDDQSAHQGIPSTFESNFPSNTGNVPETDFAVPANAEPSFSSFSNTPVEYNFSNGQSTPLGFNSEQTNTDDSEISEEDPSYSPDSMY